MQTIHEALSVVASRLGVPELQPDAQGFAEVILANALSVFFRIADEFEIEMSARIPGFDSHLGAEVLTALLRWNATSAGPRLAIEPERNGVVLGQRVDIRHHSPASLGAVLASFLLCVLDWQQHGATDLQDRVRRHSGAELLADYGALRL